MDFITNIDEIPPADLCVMKDVLQHWPSETITIFLRNIIKRKLFKYILITNCRDQGQNRYCPMGGIHPLSPYLMPLAEFNPEVVLTYSTKTTCLITP